MEDFTTYWGIIASVLTAGSAAGLYLIKSWRDVEGLKEQRQAQERQLAVLLKKVDDYWLAALEQEAERKQALDLRLQEYRTETTRELVVVRREATHPVHRLNERVDGLDKLLTVLVERQNQLLDTTRRQEARNERIDKILWARTNTNPTLGEE